MSTANAILLAAASGAVCAALSFVLTVWLADREIVRWKTKAAVEEAERKECQRRYWADDARQAAAIRALETENSTLYAELETIRHGRYVPRSIGPRVVA
jgi:hypothetical protein